VKWPLVLAFYGPTFSIPETATILLLGLGLVGLVSVKRFKR